MILKWGWTYLNCCWIRITLIWGLDVLQCLYMAHFNLPASIPLSNSCTNTYSDCLEKLIIRHDEYQYRHHATLVVFFLQLRLQQWLPRHHLLELIFHLWVIISITSFIGLFSLLFTTESYSLSLYGRQIIYPVNRQRKKRLLENLKDKLTLLLL